jgi:hypothetical protein
MTVMARVNPKTKEKNTPVLVGEQEYTENETTSGGMGNTLSMVMWSPDY